MLYKSIEANFVLILVIAIIAGVVFPQLAALQNAIHLLLAFIIFLSSFKVDINIIFNYIKDLRFFGSRFILIKFIMPLAVFYTISLFSLELALGSLLLVATPSGLSNVVLSDIFKGNNELSLAFTITSHLLSVITIPLLVFITIRESISFDYISLLISLVEIVLIPLILCCLVKKFFWHKLEPYSKYSSAISIIFIFIVVSGIVSINRGSFLEFQNFITTIIFVILLLLTMMFLGFFLGNNKKDKLAISLSSYHINAVLGLYIASTFFSKGVVVVLISAVLSLDILLVVFTWVTGHYIQNSSIKSP
ncbi:bile acid:sodium symporter [Candidatus Micrarchaeota archaeon]|nr:bile acid:sodium symporter [Candidatus Micrarchaeota archaeon]MBU1166507.1 bile acid:sodium symporter [Candidatus Micrarchaeota archaeon]MBU1887519.1 bile acid:sodium symporter [Candidatus Micrarchaeota archaeon]